MENWIAIHRTEVWDWDGQGDHGGFLQAGDDGSVSVSAILVFRSEFSPGELELEGRGYKDVDRRGLRRASISRYLAVSYSLQL